MGKKRKSCCYRTDAKNTYSRTLLAARSRRLHAKSGIETLRQRFSLGWPAYFQLLAKYS
jgi:hypothetical protein